MASLLNTALSEEVDAVNAIYGTNVLTPVDSNSGERSIDHIILRPPGQSISFILSFNRNYPQSCPQVDGTQSTGDLGRGGGHHAVKALEEILGRVWTPGMVCVFDLIEEFGALRQDEALGCGDEATVEKSDANDNLLESEAGLMDGDAEATRSNCTAPDWVVSEHLTEKKSVFVARCARVTTKEEATSFLAHLLSTNKKVAAATHNIVAWRMRNPETGVTIQDCDDDGETAAGGRLLHLVQLMDVWDVVVVVTRWYGGVKLGPDRFRLINQVARSALVKGGFAKTEEKSGKGRTRR